MKYSFPLMNVLYMNDLRDRKDDFERSMKKLVHRSRKFFGKYKNILEIISTEMSFLGRD